MSDHHDPPLRELTYRLVQMAPAAPPFPEEAVTQLKQRPEPTTRLSTQRRPWLVGLAAAAAVVVLVGLPLLAISQFGNDEAPPATQPVATTQAAVDTTPAPSITAAPSTVTPTAGPDTEPVEMEPAVVYFYDGTVLEKFVVGVAPLDPETVLQFVVDLAADEGAARFGFPAGTQILGVTVEDGIASVDFNDAFYDLPSVTQTTGELARVVFMLTEFDGIDSVFFLRDGEVADVVGADGIVLDGPQARSDYYDLLPRIFIESPVEGTTLPPTFAVSGLANTFEGNVQWRITLLDGTTVNQGFTTATCGDGCWGDFEVVIDRLFVEDTEVFIELWDVSAEDGSVQNLVEILVVVQGDPAGGEG